MEERKHLGVALGQSVKKWISEVTLLAEFATSQLQACYAAFYIQAEA